MTKKKLLWISDQPYVFTGMGIVTKEVCKILTSQYEVAVAGWNVEQNEHYRGLCVSDKDHPIKAYSIRKDMKPQEQEDVFRAIEDFKPEIVVAFGDQWNFWYMQEIYNRYPNIITGCYINVDSGPVSMIYAEQYKFYDFIITSSEFAKKEMLQIIPNRKIEVAYHGINHDKFFPLGLNKQIAKQKIGLNPTSFVIGCVARNQFRKNLPALINVYSRFAKDKDDVLLYLASDVENQCNTQVYLLELIKRNISPEKIKIQHTAPSKAFSDDHMNLVYNSFDVYALTSYAEGQCMPLMESMATGTVPVTPDAYCMREINTSGILIPIASHIIEEQERKFACVNEDVYVDALNFLYNINKTKNDQWKMLKEKAIESALRFKWIDLAKKIHSEIEKIEIEGKDTCLTSSIFG